MTQRTTTHLPGVVQGYAMSRALCRSGGGDIVPDNATCTICQRLYRIGNPMVDKVLAARLAMDNPLNLPTVVIFHVKGTPSKDVLRLFDERVPLRVVHDRTQWRTTDFVTSRSSLSGGRERFAARLGALPIVLPEQADYLQGQIEGRLARGEDVHLFEQYTGCERER